MPIYEYTCDECGEDFEKLVRSTRPKVRCTSCGSGRVTKRFSLFGMRSSRPGGGSQCSGHNCSSCNCSSSSCANCSC